MNLKNSKQFILRSLKEEEACLEGLILQLKIQKKAIESKDEKQVLQVIEKKNYSIEKFKKLEDEVESQLQSMSSKELKSLAEEGEALKENLERLIEEIIRLEEECEKEIGSTMRELEKRIFGLQEGKKIGEGYGRYRKIRPLISKKI